MMNNQEIIDNAPKREDFYFVDITGEYFDEFGNHLNSKGLWSDSDTSLVSSRSLADIRRIVELEDLVEDIINAESADEKLRPMMYHVWLFKAKALKEHKP